MAPTLKAVTLELAQVAADHLRRCRSRECRPPRHARQLLLGRRSLLERHARSAAENARAFPRAIAAAGAAMRVGDPMRDDTRWARSSAPIISRRSWLHCARARRSARVLVGGHRWSTATCQRNFVAPTVFTTVTMTWRGARGNLWSRHVVLVFDEEEESSSAPMPRVRPGGACSPRDLTRAHRVIDVSRPAPAGSITTT